MRLPSRKTIIPSRRRRTRRRRGEYCRAKSGADRARQCAGRRARSGAAGEPSIEKDIGAPAADPSSAPDAKTQRKKPTGAKAEARAKPASNETTKDKTKNKTKDKTKAQPREDRAKSSGADKRATGKAGTGGDAGNATAADEGAPILTYLRGTHIEPAPLPPAGTLPQQLEPLFPDMLSVAALLAVTAAAAGHGVHLGADKNGEGSSALRVAVIGAERHLPRTVEPVLEAAFALEREDVRRWSTEKLKLDLLGAADAARRRAYQQLLTHAGMLGLAEVSDHLDLPTVSPSVVVPRPRLVLRNPGQKNVTSALEAADAGILLVDGPPDADHGRLRRQLRHADGKPPQRRRRRSPARIAGSSAAPVHPHAPGRGVGHRPADHRGHLQPAQGQVGDAVLDGVRPPRRNSKSAPTGDAAIVLTEILGRVRALTTNAQDNTALLRLSAPARKILEQAKARLAHASTGVLRPLADYYAAAADLVRRIVVGLHVLDHAARKADRLSAEVGKDVVRRAVDFRRAVRAAGGT